MDYKKFWSTENDLIPDPRKEPSKWNEMWEELTLAYDASTHSMRMKGMFDGQPTDDILANHRNRMQLLCEHQLELTNAAAISFARDDFEAKWLQSSADYREKHLLEGLVRTSAMTPTMSDQRALCAEVTIARMQDRGGKGFLTLLKLGMLDTVSLPKTALFLPSRRWDKIVQRNKPGLTEHDIAIQAYCDGIRNNYISSFLYNTLHSFYGGAELRSPIIEDPSRHRTRAGYANIKKQVEELGLSKKVERQMKQNYKLKSKGAVFRCEACRRTEHDLRREDSNFAWKWCSKCKAKLDRRVYYCSPKCQVDDWAPRHKAICGKKLTVDSAMQSAVAQPVSNANRDDDNVIPPAKDGYIRSPALLYQINAINTYEPKGMDYCIFMPDGHPGCLYVGDVFRTVFRQARAEAMASGDRESVAVVGQFLIQGADVGNGYSHDAIYKQLNKEYGFDVKRAVQQLDKRRAKEFNGMSLLEHRWLQADPQNTVIDLDNATKIVARPMSKGHSLGPDDSNIIPPAKKGYTRSPALLLQINILHAGEPKDMDYCIFLPGEGPEAIHIPDLMRPLFRQARAEAMVSGDRESIAAVGQFLIGGAENSGFSEEILYKQLTREYGFDIKKAVQELDKRCAKEYYGRSLIEHRWHEAHPETIDLTAID